MKKLLRSLAGMCPAARTGLRLTAALCGLMFFAAYILCLCAGEPGADSFRLYGLARGLAEAPAGMLLLAGIGAVILHFGP